jgi:hypothetical protein
LVGGQVKSRDWVSRFADNGWVAQGVFQMRLLLRRSLPYLVALPIVVGLWELADLGLVKLFHDALPTNWLIRPLLVLASVALVGLVGLTILAGCSLLLLGAHRREDNKLRGPKARPTEKMAVEGRLDFDWLCQEPETCRNVDLLRSVRQ